MPSRILIGTAVAGAALLMAALVAVVLMAGQAAQDGPSSVRVLKVPDGGIVPDARLDRRGMLHVVYYAQQNVFYTSSMDLGASLSPPIRVNDRDGFAQGGLFRGPELAVADDGSLHVVWYNRAGDLGLPPTELGAMYARGRAGGPFEPSRNLSRGPADGMSVAVEGSRVVTAWQDGEAARVVESGDGGTRFSSPIDLKMLACECCDTAVTTAGKLIYVTVRDRAQDNRDMYLIEVGDGESVRRLRLDPESWHLQACPMSSSGMVRDGGEMFVTWEHAGRILLAKVDLNRWQVDAPVTVSKSGKFPLVLLDADVLLIAWKDGTRLRWQSFQPHSLERREKGSAATNSPHRPAGVAVPGGTFLLLP